MSPAATVASDVVGVLFFFALLAAVAHRALLAGCRWAVLIAAPAFALAAVGWVVPGHTGKVVMAVGFALALVAVAVTSVPAYVALRELDAHLRPLEDAKKRIRTTR